LRPGYDRKIIVERGVDAREIEVSVLGNDEPVASLPGEIIPQSADFYDYKAKYVDCERRAADDPGRDLGEELTAEIQRLAVLVFQAIDGSGLGRVRLFSGTRHGKKLLVNEIHHTMPGFTSISMYPKMWEASGISYSELIDRLIELAF